MSEERKEEEVGGVSIHSTKKSTPKQRKKKRVLSPAPLWDYVSMREDFAAGEVKELHLRTLYAHILREEKARYGSATDIGFDPEVPAQDGKVSLEFGEVFSMPKKGVALLNNGEYAYTTSRIVDAQTSRDGTTTKMCVELQDGQQVECVIMRFAERAAGGGDRRSGERVTLCVSSQVGCKMGCTFCATGTMGLLANLNAGEIIEQVLLARRLAPNLSNIVFMGMGEPLDNYDNVKAAIDVLTDNKFFAFSPARITVSTVGIIPAMRRLTKEMPHVSLAVSLHAPNQKLRQSIVPTSHQYPVTEIVRTMREYCNTTGNKVFVEYVLLKDVNDKPEHALELVDLLLGPNRDGEEAHSGQEEQKTEDDAGSDSRKRIAPPHLQPSSVTLNLIPYNPTDVRIPFDPPTREAVDTFYSICKTGTSDGKPLSRDHPRHSGLSQGGLFSTVRKEMGQDISGACGQLVLDKKKLREQVKNRKQTAPDKETKTAAPSTSSSTSCSTGSCGGGECGEKAVDMEDLLRRVRGVKELHPPKNVKRGRTAGTPKSPAASATQTTTASTPEDSYARAKAEFHSQTFDDEPDTPLYLTTPVFVFVLLLFLALLVIRLTREDHSGDVVDLRLLFGGVSGSGVGEAPVIHGLPAEV